jgi:GAF domain-containing protein
LTHSSDLASAITAAARTMHQPRSLAETLQTIAEVARNSIPGFDAVGISTVDRHGNAHTQAKTGDLVDTLDALQYSIGEGPCVDTLHGAEVVAAPSIRHDQRWPRYVPEAVTTGLRSQLAVRLFLDDEGTVGGLNLYSTASDDIDPDAESIAELFAAHAAIALGTAKQRDELNQALTSRKVIGQALGLLMERFSIGEDAAFAFLVRASSTSNTKLRDIAQELVDQANAT